MVVRNSLDLGFVEPPRCPKCHAPMTLTDVTLGAADRYTSTFECTICECKVAVQDPDVTELEADLAKVRGRVVQLEANLSPEPQASKNMPRSHDGQTELSTLEPLLNPPSGIQRPLCSKCGTPMARVRAGKYGFRNFFCSRCFHSYEEKSSVTPTCARS
jgi:hypothetical protein